MIPRWNRRDPPDATVLFPASVLNNKRSKPEKRVHKISIKNICEILNFSRSQLSFRARKKRSVGSWCPTYIFLLPKRYINNLQQELGQKLLKPWRKIIFYAKKELFLSFPANPTLKRKKHTFCVSYDSKLYFDAALTI